ncbi:MAG TPA: hypothetical protein VF329_03410 [Gammaproteobacteria bacterium]
MTDTTVPESSETVREPVDTSWIDAETRFNDAADALSVLADLLVCTGGSYADMHKITPTRLGTMIEQNLRDLREAFSHVLNERPERAIVEAEKRETPAEPRRPALDCEDDLIAASTLVQAIFCGTDGDHDIPLIDEIPTMCNMIHAHLDNVKRRLGLKRD